MLSLLQKPTSVSNKTVWPNTHKPPHFRSIMYLLIRNYRTRRPLLQQIFTCRQNFWLVPKHPIVIPAATDSRYWLGTHWGGQFQWENNCGVMSERLTNKKCECVQEWEDAIIFIYLQQHSAKTVRSYDFVGPINFKSFCIFLGCIQCLFSMFKND